MFDAQLTTNDGAQVSGNDAALIALDIVEIIEYRVAKTLEFVVNPDASVVITAPIDASSEAIEQKLQNALLGSRVSNGISLNFCRAPRSAVSSQAKHISILADSTV